MSGETPATPRRCPHCGETKPRGAFPKWAYTPAAWCKACANAASLASYERRKQRLAELLPDRMGVRR